MTTAEIAAPPVTRDVEDVLRERGLTRFHRKAILVTGAAWTFVAMEILLVGFVAPIFTNLWGLSGRMQGLVNSAALAGSLVGSLTLGRLADRIGRRAIFQYSILWYAGFTAMTALSWGTVVGDDFPLPCGPRARRDARRRSLHALRVSAAAASRPTARLPRLLVAGGPAARDRAFVPVPRADVRPLRRLELALPVRCRGVSGLPRFLRAQDAAREPVLPGAARTKARGGGGAHRDHRRTR